MKLLNKNSAILYRLQSGSIAQKKTGTRRRLIIVALVLVVVSSVALVIRTVSAPSHGHITTSSSTLKLSTERAAPKPPAPASEAQNPYFHLALPAGYRQQEGNPIVPGLLHQQTIIKSSTSGSLIIAISITSLGGGLSDNAGYHLRAQTPARYKLTQQKVQGESVTIANDLQSAAVVAFWPHGDKLATISVTTGLQNPAADDNANEIKSLQPLLSAWQWQ